MSLNEDIAQVFKDLGNLGNRLEREALERQTKNYHLSDWKAEGIAMVVGSGALSLMGV